MLPQFKSSTSKNGNEWEFFTHQKANAELVAHWQEQLWPALCKAAIMQIGNKHKIQYKILKKPQTNKQLKL